MDHRKRYKKDQDNINRYIDGVFLLFGGSKEDAEEGETGGRNMFKVRLWCKSCRHASLHKVL